MLSMFLSVVSIAALAASSCYITIVSLNFILGTLKPKLYNKKIFYQALKLQSTWKLRFRVYPEDKGRNAKRLAKYLQISVPEFYIYSHAKYFYL